jgi:hypothetical protein
VEAEARVRARWIVAVALAFLAPAASGDAPTHFVLRVQELLASPTPLAGDATLGDAWAWRLDVPEGVVVCVSAREHAVAPFSLSATGGPNPPASPAPALEQGFELQGPATWTLTVDPALAGPVDVTVDLAGHYVECGNEPAPFDVTALPPPAWCATPVGGCPP